MKEQFSPTRRKNRPGFVRRILLIVFTLLPIGLVAAVGSRLLPFAKSRAAAGEKTWSTPDETRKTDLLKQYGRLPLRFEINEGQTDQQVKFLSRGPGYDLFLTSAGAVLTLQKPGPILDRSKSPSRTAAAEPNAKRETAVIRLQFKGANPNAIVRGAEELPGKVNYLVGNDPRQWHTNIPTYHRVQYEEIYSGVDMVYYGNQQQLEFDFLVKPGANPRVIEFRVDGTDRIRLNKAGDLVLQVAHSEVTLQKPVVYQQTDQGERREIKGDYVIDRNNVRFKVKGFDSSKPLVIDPVLSYSTLLGATREEYGYGIAVDPFGNAYITGQTASGNFPTTPGAFQIAGSFGGAFVSKLNATGTDLIYSTYLSGNSASGSTNAKGIAVDASGDAYVAGYTSAADFPTLNPLRGGRNNLLITTDSGGNWAPSNVGSANRSIQALAIDRNSPSTIYAGGGFNGGLYRSTDGGATWTALNTGLTNFACPAIVIDPTSSNIVYAALIPQIFGSATGVYKSIDSGNTWTQVSSGLNSTQVTALAIDPQNHLTLYAGGTFSLFKSTNGGTSWVSSSTGLNFGSFTAIVVDPTTPTTIYATAGGGGVFKSTNAAGNWSQVNNGLTSPTVRALVMDPTATSTLYAGTGNGGLFKTTDGGANWSKIINGPLASGTDVSSLVIVPTSTSTVFAGTSDGRVLKTTNGGGTWTVSYLTTTNTVIKALAIDSTSPAKVVAGVDSTNNSLGSPEAFVAKLNPSGSGLLYSTFIGGSLDDEANAIAIDANGNTYIAGLTTSSDFPTVNPAQATFGGGQSCTDAFITKIDPSGSALSFSTFLGGTSCDVARGIALDGAGNVYVTGQTLSANLATPGAFQTSLGDNTGDAFVSKLNPIGSISYVTYLGGSRADVGYGVAADSQGNAYVAGTTQSLNFPTANPIQPSNGYNGNFFDDVFVTKINPTGTALIYSTYLGGSDMDFGDAIALDSNGNAYVTGATTSINFPLVTGALRTKSPLFQSSDGGNTWSNENFGLNYSQINVLAIDPTATAKIYAGTPINNFRSIDGGRTWITSMTGLSFPVVTSIVVNPTTPSTVYLSSVNSGSHGVFKSTDSGLSWIPANNGLNNASVACIALDPATPTTLYAITGSALFKSVDNAGTWNQVGPQTFSALSLVIDPLNPTTLYATSGSNNGLLKSTDSGANWQAINNGLTSSYITHLVIDPQTPSTLYAAGGGGVLSKSTNGGASWTTISNTLQGPLAVDPSHPANIYATGTGNTGLFKSTDGGATWKSINSALRNPFTIAVHPTNSSIVYVSNALPLDSDAFVTKLNPSGNAFVYSTLIGGSSSVPNFNGANDQAFAIAVDAAGSAYVTGTSTSSDFSVDPNSYQPFNRGLADAFVVKLGTSYIISGQVMDASNAPVSGAQVTLSDGSSLTQVFTESDGSYQFAHLREGGNFTVSAAKPHFTMAPPSQTFNNLTSNQTQNFVATATNAPFFAISGQITNNGSGLSGVTITLSGSQQNVQTTDSNGNYSFTLAGGGNYTVTPSILAFSFSPPNQTFNNLSADQTANFSGTRLNFVVTNANDHGAGSLRQAIMDANATQGLDTITFNIPGSGVHTINLLIGLPVITDPVVIDAATQPGYSGAPLIELNGTQAGGNGFQITAGSSTIRGFIINKFTNGGAAGILLTTNGNNTIQGNFIGTDAAGAVGRNNYNGIVITSGSANNLIGGTTASARNVISGNSFDGISVNTSGNQIQGNFIGTNALGTAAIPTGTNGIELTGSGTTSNLIGGTTSGAGNLISGNPTGIYALAPGATVQGNLIGTDLTGTQAVPNGTGIRSDGSNNLIGGTVAGARNVISGNTQGVYITGVGSKLQGNFIGTDITGTVALGNTQGGVFGGNQALIGGTVPGARNIISGNAGNGGVSLGYNVGQGNAVTVQGNFIGTDVTGNIALPNLTYGITVSSSNNVIGGATTSAANVISGNATGIEMGSLTTATLTGNIVQGNLIGLNANGNMPLPNSDGGIALNGFVNNSRIGGPTSDLANTIAFNGGNGVAVSSGTGNLIQSNSIFSNVGLGIDLSPFGVTPNDTLDADTGANNLQNWPQLTSVNFSGGTTSIQGTLNSTPNTTFRVDFYSNAACDISGNGEGGRFFDTTNVATDANGNATINFTSGVALPAGRVLTATATDPSGNTSEFSPCDSTNAMGSVSFDNHFYYVLEDVGTAVINVVRTGGSKGTISINYSTADGTATAGSDYTAISGTLVFADGETTKPIQLPIANDGVTEPGETLRLSLTGYTEIETLGSYPVATVTIQDNSTPLYIIPIGDVNNATEVSEGDSGITNAIVPVHLSAQTSRTVTVDYNTQGVSATSGVDFNPVSGSLTFSPKATLKTVSVPIVGDTLDENNETFAVVFTNPVNAILSPTSETVRILDNDPLPVLTISDVAVNEGNSGTTNAVFNLSLSPASGRSVFVSFNTANGTATSGSDYVSSSGSVTFTAGQTTKTVTIQVNGDTTVEANETFLVNLFSSSNATISKAQGVGMILDDDGQTPLQLILEEGTNQVGAVDSLLLTRSPFSVQSIARWFNLGSDPNTHLLVFVRNLQLNQGETAAAIEVTLVSGAFSTTVQAEDVRPVQNSDLSQVRFRLPDGLPAGVCTVSVRVHGQPSNSGIIQILQ